MSTTKMPQKNVTKNVTKCVWCGKTLPVQHGSGRRRLYCSASCKQRAYESRKYKIGEVWDFLQRNYTHCYLRSEPLEWDKPQTMCLDHMIATVHGGRTDVQNLRPVHIPCNARKGAKLYIA